MGDTPPKGKASDSNRPDNNTSSGNSPDGKTSAGKVPDDKLPDDKPRAITSPADGVAAAVAAALAYVNAAKADESASDGKKARTIAIIAGVFSLVAALVTGGMAFWSAIQSNANARTIEQIKSENEILKEVRLQQRETSKYKEPLARATYELQGRLYLFLDQRFATDYLVNGDAVQKAYGLHHTVFLAAEYLCWTELARRDIQFIDLGESKKTRELADLQDNVSKSWGVPISQYFRILEGNQRAIGEALIETNARGSQCMGYGAFLKHYPNGVDSLIDDLRKQVQEMSDAEKFKAAKPRLERLQRQLVRLLDLLDPDKARFPADRRTVFAP